MKTIILTDEDYNDLISCLADHGELGFIEFIERKTVSNESDDDTESEKLND